MTEAFPGSDGTSTLVIAGEEDTDRGSVEALAALLPHGRLCRVSGNHYTASLAPELVEEIVRFPGNPTRTPCRRSWRPCRPDR